MTCPRFSHHFGYNTSPVSPTEVKHQLSRGRYDEDSIEKSRMSHGTGRSDVFWALHTMRSGALVSCTDIVDAEPLPLHSSTQTKHGVPLQPALRCGSRTQEDAFHKDTMTTSAPLWAFVRHGMMQMTALYVSFPATCGTFVSTLIILPFSSLYA